MACSSALGRAFVDVILKHELLAVWPYSGGTVLT